MAGFFDTPIEFLKGVGPQRAALLNKELNIFTFGDFIQHYPFRYEDRTTFYKINELNDEQPFIQIKGFIKRREIVGEGFKKRLVVHVADQTGYLELVWFQGINWINEKLKPGVEYVVFGKPSRFGSKLSMAHPEIEVVSDQKEVGGFLQPVYPLTEKLRARHLDSKSISKFMKEMLSLSKEKIRETLPQNLLSSEQLLSKSESLINIHFPQHQEILTKAIDRLKFEELFYIQLRLIKMKIVRKDKFKGQIFQNPALLTTFYNEHLPFVLTDAQKKVIKEIHPLSPHPV